MEIFKHGWRHALGWVCVAAIGLNYLFMPLAGPVLLALTSIILEPLDMVTMMPLIIGMTGISVTTTVEKTRDMFK